MVLQKGSCCGEKNPDTSPLLQRHRRLNELFRSAPFSFGEVVKFFYISLPSSLVHG